jgi:hypothetical protein
VTFRPHSFAWPGHSFCKHRSARPQLDLVFYFGFLRTHNFQTTHALRSPFTLALRKNGYRNLQRSQRKKKELLIEIRSSRRRAPRPASFSHRLVGSSILASLSEAGGRPRLPFLHDPRHLPILQNTHNHLQTHALAHNPCPQSIPFRHPKFLLESFAHYDLPHRQQSAPGPSTRVTKIFVTPELLVFFRISATLALHDDLLPSQSPLPRRRLARSRPASRCWPARHHRVGR